MPSVTPGFPSLGPSRMAALAGVAAAAAAAAVEVDVGCYAEEEGDEEEYAEDEAYDCRVAGC